MIIGIGTDIIEIKRVKKLIDNTNFMERFFTEGERAYLRVKKPESTAGYFSAKEAVVKALGTGFSGFKWTDVEIVKKNSVPEVVLRGNAASMASDRGIKVIHLTISHSKEYATATAIAEGQEGEKP